MSHTPPVPEGNQSPYPLTPAPHTEATGVAVVEIDDVEQPDEEGPSLTLIGSAVAGVGAAVAAVWYLARRRKAPAPSRRAARPRKTAAKRTPRARAKKTA